MKNGQRCSVKVIDSNRAESTPIFELIGKEYAAVFRGEPDWLEQTFEIEEPAEPFKGKIQLAPSEVEVI